MDYMPSPVTGWVRIPCRGYLPGALPSATLSPRIVAEVLAQIALKLQKFVPERHQPRTPRDKPHKFHAYKPGS